MGENIRNYQGRLEAAYQGSLVVRLPLRFSLVFPLALSVLDLRYMRLPFLIQFSHRLGLPFVLPLHLHRSQFLQGVYLLLLFSLL